MKQTLRQRKGKREHIGILRVGDVCFLLYGKSGEEEI